MPGRRARQRFPRGQQLSRAQVAAMIDTDDGGHWEPDTVSKALRRSRHRRSLGATQNLFPEPGGYIGQSPWWWEGIIREWMVNDRLRMGDAPLTPVPKVTVDGSRRR